MDRIISMILRRLMNRGINAGINHVANRGRNPEDMSNEDRNRAKQGRDGVKRTRQAMRIARRFGKF
ncbi:hypothetical protein [Aestuariibius sp. HNIBRBA575]|uniref:hypothetical protein n=1 Tax=Aestuariibius sp. HNIBRBA575 TaxID=3233343 RepID=UPI0034A49DF6